ncbi:hypothetical protein INT45_005477 [Circinella minor]|uniref:Uncharacterized protein n=1 Tax=Circinella minor TaxID=1195481 RepID=A0A8H7RXL5_9FUNG|nr:hypothetical protein INT45_005477 [Circinella minor]
MATLGEHNAARAQRSAARNATIQQDNIANNALLQLEDRVQAMGDVIARQALAQQQVQPPLAVNQNPEPVAMHGAMEGFRAGRLAKVSAAIHHQNTALGAEGFRWNEGLQRYDIQEEQLLKKIYDFFDNQQSKIRRLANQAEQRRMCDAFQMHWACLQEMYSEGEVLLKPEYMSDEETDDEYNRVIGKRVLVRKPHWRNEKANELLCLLDELKPSSNATRLVKVVGDVRVVALSSDEQ